MASNRVSLAIFIVPQVPAAVCSMGLVLTVGLSKVALHIYGGTVAPWIVLLLGVVLSVAYYLGFLLFSGFSEVRNLVCETLDDIAPSIARRVITLTTGKRLTPAVEQS